MKCLIADDEQLILNDIRRTAIKVLGESTEIYEASNSDETLNIIQDNDIPIVFWILRCHLSAVWRSRIASEK